ncbi:twin transmembrane helix small protein [Teichococcus vastitatis]|uniref:Twin transmembrane helix small protein n=1 Tax=Teichococcus vastitatis TaxID=2307076 RepID=A0ABS9W5Q4_9PROT|nr:twin transmembrane helix small protein [Pseudoroseomonas vastitatis]MCI0754626.1 twin transmembrane helix small protein [Pseudoroseomonas vastitatis]
MVTFLSILLGLAMLATLGVMFAGMLGLARGEEGGGGARSNNLMRWRVGLQGVAIALFAALMLAMRG